MISYVHQWYATINSSGELKPVLTENWGSDILDSLGFDPPLEYA